MKTKFYFVILLLFLLLNLQLTAQNTFPSYGKVGIGTTTPNASSLLEVASTTKGVLIPRMTESQRNAIASPATGLIIFQTNNNPGFFYYSGTGWLGLAAKINTWNVTGNGTIDSASNFIGTTNKVPFSIRTNNVERVHVSSNGNVGIGVSSPAALLHINGGGSASLTNNGYVLLGKTNNYNLVVDNEQIQARDNGAYSDLFINAYGGSVIVGNTSNSYDGILAAGSANGVYGESPNGTGIYGTGGNYGMQGNATNGTGIYGVGGTGIYGYDSTNGIGVWGYDYGDATKHWGYGTGVFGKSFGGNGVYGVSIHSNGVYGYTAEGEYAGYFDGDLYTAGTYTSSDATLKQNITDMQGAMSIIDQLKPKYYNFRSDGNYELMNLPKGKHYGLIAQDVEKVLPGLIKDSKFDAGRTKHIAQMGNLKDSSKQFSTASSKDEIINFKALNYTELIPIIIKGMQEMNDSLKAENSALNERLTKIETMLNINAVSAGSVSSYISSASLAQNIPNPFSSATTIGYNLPSNYSSANIIVTDAKGVVLKQISLNSKGKGDVQLDASTLAAGAYRYSLYVDGKLVDSKQMISSK